VNSPKTRKVFFGGTHRISKPRDTWDRIEPLLGTFDVTRIADVTRLDTLGIPVAVAVRPLAQTLSVSQGKGHTLLLAKISAAMEAIELWHAENNVSAPDLRAIAASRLSLPYALDQLDHEHGSIVTEQFPMDWLIASGLSTGRSIPVPFGSVSLALATENVWKPVGLRASSNGLASGNSSEEASVHAIYELIERDALFAMRQAARESEIKIDLSSIDDPMCCPLIDRVLAQDAYLEVLMVDNRWCVPCFAAFIWSEDFPVFAVGSGAHSSISVALSRAITEAAQSRLTAISGGRDDQRPVYSHVYRGATTRPSADEPGKDIRSIAPQFAFPEFTDVSEELVHLSDLITRETGSEPMMVDLSSRDDFAVVRVLGTGMSYSGSRHPTSTAVRP
jgi:ribosomal protein S12 methylthiotransferase accessory factor